MWIQCLLMDLIHKHQWKKFVEVFIKSFNQEKPFTGELVIGMLIQFLMLLEYVKNIICINQYALKINTTCLLESKFSQNMKTCSKITDQD